MQLVIRQLLLGAEAGVSHALVWWTTRPWACSWWAVERAAGRMPLLGRPWSGQEQDKCSTRVWRGGEGCWTHDSAASLAVYCCSAAYEMGLLSMAGL